MQLRSRNSWIAAVGIGLAVLAAQQVGIAPASATTIPAGSVQVFSKLSGFSSADKSQRANCPAGQRAIGGGGLTGGGSHVIISGARPISDADGDGFLITAQEDQFGVAGVWSLQAFVFCAVAPPGLQVVVSAGPALSSPSFGNAVSCPQGKFAIGVGGEITGGLGQVDLGMFALINSSGQATTVEPFAKEDADGFAGNYTLTSYAICASQNVAGDFQVVERISTADTSPSKNVVAPCPSGLRATAAAGVTFTAGTHVQSFRPNSAIAPSQITVAAASSVAIGTPWVARATVFCAR